MDSRHYSNCQNNFTFPVKTQEAARERRAGLHHTVRLVLFHSNDGPCLKFCQGLQQPRSSADPVTPLVPASRAATSQLRGLNSISVCILIPRRSLLQVRGSKGTLQAPTSPLTLAILVRWTMTCRVTTHF